jgi:hypothetical protein
MVFVDLIRVFVEEVSLAVLTLDNGLETKAMVRRKADEK